MSGTNTLLGKITSNGWEGNVVGNASSATNADTIDGYHASSFQKHLDGMISDFNATLADGEYSFGSNSALTGSPENGGLYGKLIVKVNDGGTHNNSTNWIWQFAYCTNGQNYWRYKVNNGVWQSWRKLSDGGNSDAVDGYHVGSATGNYLRPINYGTSALTPGSSSLATGTIYLQYE